MNRILIALLFVTGVAKGEVLATYSQLWSGNGGNHYVKGYASAQNTPNGLIDPLAKFSPPDAARYAAGNAAAAYGVDSIQCGQYPYNYAMGVAFTGGVDPRFIPGSPIPAHNFSGAMHGYEYAVCYYGNTPYVYYQFWF